MLGFRLVCGVLCTVIAVFLVSAAGATSLGEKPYDANLMASWVQAIGSIAAIGGAIWIASSEQRRSAHRLEEEARERGRHLQVELRWVSSDVVDFLNRFVDAVEGMPNTVKIDDIDVAELLERLTWCRQRAATGEQLAAVGALRSALMHTVRHIRDRSDSGFLLFELEDLSLIGDARKSARKAWSEIQGVVNVDE